MRVKIYSNEHTAWWKENYLGYTNNESEAGIFEIEEVNKYYPYIDFDTTKEDYLVKFNKLTYEELLKENEKLKKDLEIIKNKCVNVNTLINSIIGAINPLEFYNEKVSTNLKLTQQEYELLKEVLCE